ncbi:MAG TPA: magnesium transporter CorA family protein [Flexivirga sp.]|uniref:magnesium transporter CorA family protein n=1 Tax=Flexivirga sp. TaxID=1962927 RepID=UPI002C2135F1|nr:magnesium transporter CorA family protein [Flexivirga sp.]HWC21173.1 magnesium transporter CorA family protein [Flexivirga sp.]
MTCERRSLVWRSGELDRSDVSLRDLPELLSQDGTLTWVDLIDPEHADVRELAAALDLDEHTVEDALTQHERPKAVRFTSYFFITCFTVSQLADDSDLHRMSIIVLPRAVVTLRLGGNFPVDDVESAFADNPDLVKLGAKALLHTILDTVVDGYFDVTTRIDDQVDDLEGRLFAERHAGPAIAREAYDLHKRISRMRRVALPMREVVTTILRRIGGDDEQHDLLPFYEDLYDHTMRVAEWTESLRDTMQTVQDTNLALGDAALNNIMKKLTSWAAIIAVPTLITGWYGQNVPYPGFGAQWGFWFSTVLMVVIAVVLYVVFKRRNWL